jgi:hypothetical protein
MSVVRTAHTHTHVLRSIRDKYRNSLLEGCLHILIRTHPRSWLTGDDILVRYSHQWCKNTVYKIRPMDSMKCNDLYVRDKERLMAQDSVGLWTLLH